MAPNPAVKTKRRKNRKARTEVSSDSDSDTPPQTSKTLEKKETTTTGAVQSTPEPNTAISAAFTKFYLQQSTVEFAEDLDRLRGAQDFKNDALPILIEALQQGTNMFSEEEKRRIMMAGEVGEDGK